MTRALQSICLAIGILFSMAGPSLAGENPALTQAVQDYNSKKYRDALTKLDGLSRSGKANDKAHYYMALSYQGINQMATAKSEYMWVYSKSADNTLRYKAWQALQSMERWSQHRSYEGQGNDFNRLSPVNSSGEKFREQKTAAQAKQDAEDAAAAAASTGCRRSSGGCHR